MKFKKYFLVRYVYPTTFTTTDVTNTLV